MLLYKFVLTARVQKQHEEQVGKHSSGKFGEGALDTTEIKPGTDQDSEV